MTVQVAEAHLTKADVAALMKVSESTVQRLVRVGRLGCIRHGHRTLRFTEAQVAAYLATQAEAPAPPPVKPRRNPKYDS